MIDIYISEDGFHRFFNKDYPIRKLLQPGDHKPHRINIKVAEDFLQHFTNDPQSEDYLNASKLGVMPESDNGLSKRVLEIAKGGTAKINSDLACSIFVLNGVTHDMTQRLKQKLGIICLSDNNPDLTNYSGSNPGFSLESGDKSSWEDIIGTVSSLPKNSILFCDRFLHTNDKLSWDNYFPNLFKILSTLITGNKITISFLFEHSYNKEVAELRCRNDIVEPCVNSINKVVERFKKCDKNKEISIIAEFLCFQKGDSSLQSLSQAGHDRFIISNYSFISATKTFAALDSNDRAKVAIQKFDSLSIFGHVNYRNTHHIYRSHISQIIQEKIEHKTNDIICFKYSTSNNLGVNRVYEINKLTNNLIMEFKIFYLSVPYDNDWSNIEILPDTYSANKNFDDCVWSTEEETLTKMQTAIKKYFSQKAGFVQVQPDDKDKYPYYRIYVKGQSNIRTIDYKTVQEGQEKIENQFQYEYNCFKYEKDAIDVVNCIKNIIGESDRI